MLRKNVFIWHKDENERPAVALVTGKVMLCYLNFDPHIQFVWKQLTYAYTQGVQIMHREFIVR